MTKDNSDNLEQIGKAKVAVDKEPENQQIQIHAANIKRKGKVKSSDKTSRLKNKPISGREKAKSWYYNRYQIVTVQRNILLIFSIFAMIAVTVCVIFVKTITESKSLEPYVIELEEKTGIPVVVDQQTVAHFTGNQVMVRYFLNQFIHGASGYNPRTYKLDALRIRLMSTAAVHSDFLRRIRARDLGGDATIQVRIKSIQFPTANSVQVRILRVVQGERGASSVNELIDMDYKFTSLNLNHEERMINPVGFQVGRYLITEEVYEY